MRSTTSPVDSLGRGGPGIVTCLWMTRYAGLTQRDVADVLGVGTGVAVSLQLRRFEELVGEHPKLRTVARKCDKAFASLMKKRVKRT